MSKRGPKPYRQVEDLIILFALTLAEHDGKSVDCAARYLAGRHVEWRMKHRTACRRFYSLKEKGLAIKLDEGQADMLRRALSRLEIFSYVHAAHRRLATLNKT